MESVGEVTKRFNRVFRAFNRFAHQALLKDKNAPTTNIIAITHSEVANNFLESVFGFGFSHHGDYPKQELGRGESLTIEARNTPDGALRYFATMRSQTVEFDFDSHTNQFTLNPALERNPPQKT